MNIQNLRPVFAGALLAIAIASLGCGARAAEPEQAAPTAPPAWNVQKDLDPSPPAPQPTPEVVPSVTPAPADDPVPAASPRVLWLRSSHAGPGAVTIRFASNVPVTAKVMAMTNQVGPAALYTEELNGLATSHTTSVPASAFGRYKFRIEDAQGNGAWAELRYKSDPQGVDWGTGAAAPTLKAPTAKQLDVTYAFPAGSATKLGLDGTVHVFMTDAGCTTADACVGDQVGLPLSAPAAGNVLLEQHAATAGIPGSAFDYQVVIGQPLLENGATMVFIQLDIRGDQLPKVNFQTPGVIKK